MRKVQKINLEFEEEEIMAAIGVSSGYSDYRMAWTLNNVFDWKFEFSPETLCIPVKKSSTQYRFHFHQYKSNEDKFELYLLKNKQEGKSFFEDYPQFDFVLFFRKNISLNPEEVLKELRELDPIIAAYRCSSSDFVSSKFLIFD
jgi:hypothetical protein